MTITPGQLFLWPASHVRMPYDAGPRRLDDGHDGTDCSGLVVRSFRARGISTGSATTSTALQEWAASSGGRIITVAQAIATTGAGLFIWGFGADGHVALSRGNGSTWETPAWGPYGHALGIGNAYGRGWTAGCLWPQVNYSGHAPGPVPYPPLTRLLRRGTAGADVREAQQCLKVWAHVWAAPGVDPGPVDGMYGPRTESAVSLFQHRRRLVVDGVVGPATWAALWGH